VGEEAFFFFQPSSVCDPPSTFLGFGSGFFTIATPVLTFSPLELPDELASALAAEEEGIRRCLGLVAFSPAVIRES
jgi:hypothetical protein